MLRRGADPADERGRPRSAYEKLYRRYARSVFGLALRRLGDRGRAEDAVQETFASVWRVGEHVPARSADRARRGSTASRGTRSSTAAACAPSRRPRRPTRRRIEPSPEDRAEQAWTSWRVHRALEALPEREREVLVLAYWSDLSQSEVAKRLGIPLGTVKTRTRSALQRLATILERRSSNDARVRRPRRRART